jgi:hypothetical protein
MAMLIRLGIPDSRVMMLAISSDRSSRPSAIWRHTAARSAADRSAQVGKAVAAACAARSTSSRVPSGVDPITWPFVESIMVRVALPVEAAQPPSM